MRVQGPPLGGVGFAPHVMELDMIPAIEAEAETALTPVGVTGVPLAKAVVYVVVDDPVVNERATPVEGTAGVVAVAGDLVGVVGHAFVVVSLGGEKVVGREGIENGLRRVGAGGGDVVRNSVINEAGEIQGFVVKEGSGDGGAAGVIDRDTVADKSAIGVVRSRNGGREDVIVGDCVVPEAVIVHGNGEPVAQIGGIGLAWSIRIAEKLGMGLGEKSRDVASGTNEGILEIHPGDAIRIGDLGSDDGILGIRRLPGSVLDLADIGGCHRAGDAVNSPGGGGTGDPVGI